MSVPKLLSFLENIFNPTDISFILCFSFLAKLIFCLLRGLGCDLGSRDYFWSLRVKGQLSLFILYLRSIGEEN